MRAKLHIKKGDLVKVIAGDSKGQEGKVLTIIVEKNKAIVEGINMVSKHTKPNAKNSTTSPYRPHPGRSAYRAYPHNPAIQNKPLNTSLRSAIHATDSTFSGCSAKSDATRKLRQNIPVIRSRMPNRRRVLSR